MTKICSSATYSIKDVLDGKTHFIVPDYQRAYTWKRDIEVEDLYNDLEANWKDSSEQAYLLGPIVVVKRPLLDSPYEIVDGQQRLVTITLLFCAMRAALQYHSPSAEDKADYDELMNDINKSILSDNKPLIELQDQDNQYFEKICHDNLSDDTKPKNKIVENYHELLNRFSIMLCGKDFFHDSSTYRDGLRRIKNVLRSIQDNNYFVYIEISDPQYSYQVFQSLNSKGQSLTQAALIKSHLLSVSSNKSSTDSSQTSVNKVHEKWKQIMQTSRTGDQVDDFLYYSMLSRKCDKDVSKKNLYSNVRERINNTDDAFSYLEELETDSKIFSMLKNPQNSNEQYKDLFYGTKRINAKYFLRPIIAVYREWGPDDKRTWKVIDCLVKFFFMYRTICKRDIDQLKKISKKITCEIQNNADLKTIFSTILFHDTTNNENITQEEFLREFRENPYLPTGAALYLLHSLEHHLQGDTDAPKGYDYQLEHIFPKSPKPEDWHDMHALKEHLNHLGNLTLLSPKWNSALSNRSFKDKMHGNSNMRGGAKCYKKSALKLNQDHLAGYTKWDSDEIKKRMDGLLKIVERVWNLTEYREQAKNQHKADPRPVA